MPFFVSKHLIALLTRLADQARSAEHAATARVAALEKGLTEALAKVAVLERQNAIAQSNAEWLKHHVNLLTQERTDRVFLEMRKIGVSLEAPTIESLSPDKSAIANPEAEARAQRVAEATAGAGIFEDMGDEAAEAHGLRWNAAGGVEST